ncbi:MAG: LytTR family DNA-binding domain-containing protein [Bacteroidales bacterium]|nr:LytTR family DNA-binding domain-containing protein [Bacteroidales bacterium]
MKISCAVIDDEPLAVELMESYVKKTPFLELKGSFGSGVIAFNALQDNPVDLIFCDIQMPGLNGMELSRMIPESTRIIFTTAFSNYALEGFKVNALDYLLKPISYTDFLGAAQKALDYFQMRDAANTGATAAANGPTVKSIFVKTEYRLQQIKLSDILFVEGMKDYVKIYVENSDPILSLMNMKTLEEQLPKDQFYRVHRSYIVRIDKISTIERNRIIFGKHYVPISENERDNFFEVLSRHSIIS